MSIPSSRPETTIERAVARRWSGARSPTRGSMSCGVTVETAVRNDITRKTENDFVTHKPTHLKMSVDISLDESDSFITKVAVKKTKVRTNALRRNMSPSGHKKSSPTA